MTWRPALSCFDQHTSPLFTYSWGGGGDEFLRGLFRGGHFRRGKISPPLHIPKLTLPHAHTALPKPQISPGEYFATSLEDEIFTRNHPPTLVEGLEVYLLH